MRRFAKILFLLTVGLAAGAPGKDGSPAEIHVSPDRRIFGYPQVPLVEPYLAADPVHPNHLVGAAMGVTINTDLTVTTCYALSSWDGGQTWQAHDLKRYCVDVWVSISDRGTAIVSALSREGLQVFRSADGGRTWPDVPLVLPHPPGKSFDHDTMTVDRSTGRFRGSIYLLAAQFSADTAQVILFRSDDDGQSFSKTAEVVPFHLEFNTMNPGVFSDGILVVPFNDFQRPLLKSSQGVEAGRGWMMTSSDGGKTFSPPYMISESCKHSFPELGVDPNAGSLADRLYWVCNDGDHRRIYFHYSPDRGATWSAPLQVNRKSGSHADARTAMVAVNRDHVVGVAWFDGREDPHAVKRSVRCQSVYFAASVDGGETFLPEVKVSTAHSCPHTPENGEAGRRWVAGGDYMGLVADADGVFHLLWSDSRSGIYELWTSTIRVRAETRHS
jgi:hypothetical protein